MSIDTVIKEHLEVIQAVQKEELENIHRLAALCHQTLLSNGTIYFVGNGGSAADCQHLAAEFVGRFQTERRGLASVALTTDTSVLTAIGNDYGFENVFARQVEALVQADDLLIGISTSGNSLNILRAIDAAKNKKASVVGMTGEDGGKLKEVCDICIRVPSSVTARIQEAHIMIGHIVCQLVDEVIGNV